MGLEKITHEQLGRRGRELNTGYVNISHLFGLPQQSPESQQPRSDFAWTRDLRVSEREREYIYMLFSCSFDVFLSLPLRLFSYFTGRESSISFRVFDSISSRFPCAVTWLGGSRGK